MDEFHVNTTTEGSQYDSRHIELDDGHVIIWHSSSPIAIYGQKYNNNFEKIDNEFIITDISHPKSGEIFKTKAGFCVIFKQNDGQLYTKFYDNECNILSDTTRINTLVYGNINSDAQKNIVEITDGCNRSRSKLPKGIISILIKYDTWKRGNIMTIKRS